jgi:RNA polymerase sigma-70 factor, ECF subfamily
VDSSDATDEELISRHVQGDSEAFGELFRRHRDRLWAIALRTLGDPEEAADALQDALISAFRRASAFRGDAAVTTWMYRIVVNACMDRVRRHPGRRVVLAGEAEALDLIADPVVDHTRRHDDRIDVSAALVHLSAEHRAALVLVDMHGYSVDEAARILDVAPGTVKSRCARGRARLAELLGVGEQRNQPARTRVPSTGHRGGQRSDATQAGRAGNTGEGGEGEP